MSVDWTVNIGHLWTLAAFAVMLILQVGASRANYGNLRNDMTDLKAEIKKLSEIVTEQAVQGKRIDRIEEDIRELRHGEGFVFPLNFLSKNKPSNE